MGDIETGKKLSVSAHSSAMPSLVKISNISFSAFPAGILEADYLVTRHATSGNKRVLVIENYVPGTLEEKTRFIEELIESKFKLIKSQGPVLGPLLQYRLYKKIIE